MASAPLTRCCFPCPVAPLNNGIFQFQLLHRGLFLKFQRLIENQDSRQLRHVAERPPGGGGVLERHFLPDLFRFVNFYLEPPDWRVELWDYLLGAALSHAQRCLYARAHGDQERRPLLHVVTFCSRCDSRDSGRIKTVGPSKSVQLQGRAQFTGNSQ